MVLAMPRPIKHPKTGIYYHRQRVPTDVAASAKGQKVSVTIDGRTSHVTIGDFIKISLRTKEAPHAKQLAVEAQAEFDRIWNGFRGSEVHLTNKQCVALAGEIYKTFTETIEEDPGSPEIWKRVQADNAFIRNNPTYVNPLLIRGVPEDLVEKKFGPLIDVVLRKHHLRITSASRRQLLSHVLEALDEAAALLERRAKGDYRRDENAERFPPFNGPTNALQVTFPMESGKVVTFDQIIDAEAEHRSQGREARPLPTKTVKQNKSHCREFATFRGPRGNDATSVTLAELEAWVSDLQKKGENTNRTIVNKARTIQTVLGWGMTRFRNVKRLEDAVAQVSKFRPPKFSRKDSHLSAIWLEEAPVILRAARKAKDIRCRWLPWLAAYTGARIAELSQLEREDFAEHEGIWYFRITDSDGRHVKNDSSKLRGDLSWIRVCLDWTRR